MHTQTQARKHTPPPHSEAAKTAIVLSGGGAYGAYEVGVLRALSNGLSPSTAYRPLEADIYAGTSAGAFNATFLAANADLPLTEAVSRLESVWIRQIAGGPARWGNGVFRFRFDPFSLLNPLVVGRDPIGTLRRFAADLRYAPPKFLNDLLKILGTRHLDPATGLVSLIDLSSLISMEPLRKTLERTIDYEKVQKSPKTLSIAATNWRLGRLILASKHDMSPVMGPQINKGSASIPGIFPATQIGNETVVDGGVLMNTPLDPAIQAGAETLHVIDLSPTTAHSPMMLLSTLGMINRAVVTTWDNRLQLALRNAVVWLSLERHRAKIAQQTQHMGLGHQDRALLMQKIDALVEVVCHELGVVGRRLTVHFLRPERYLGGGPLGLLNFNRSQLTENIEQGFHDAISHNCLDSGCLLAHRDDHPDVAVAHPPERVQ